MAVIPGIPQFFSSYSDIQGQILYRYTRDQRRLNRKLQTQMMCIGILSESLFEYHQEAGWNNREFSCLPDYPGLSCLCGDD